MHGWRLSVVDPDLEETEPDLLGTLVRALERRHRLDDELARRDHDEQIAELVQVIARAETPDLRTEPIGTPPRRAAVAMALAVLSAPHFSVTLPSIRHGTTDPGDAPRRALQPVPASSPDGLERALGLGTWEIDELRDEIDRRVGTVLKQARTVNWLWAHFGLPDPAGAQALARILVPGLPDEPLDVAWRNGQLYVLTNAEVFRPAALFLPWLRPTSPDVPSSFDSRGVDESLRSRLGRAIGADDDEVNALLDRTVTLLPRRSAASLLHHDQWRAEGLAGITDLGSSYSRGTSLIEPEPADGFEWRVWLEAEAGKPLRSRYTAERLFDALAIPRAGALLRQLHVAMLAAGDRQVTRGIGQVRPEDVDLYDVPHHLRRVLDPLFHWIDRPATHLYLARGSGRSVDEVAALLDGIGETWRVHAVQRWFGGPGATGPSVQNVLVQHLIVLRHSLVRTLTSAEDQRGPHADLALLFAAHFLRDASLERTLSRTRTATDEDEASEEPTGPIAPPEDPVGHWFWPLWRRLLDESEREPTTPA